MTEALAGARAGTWAVLCNYNGGEENLVCLAALAAEGLPPERTVFVDNASSDGSLERVAAEFPGVVLLSNATNEGYGHATNRGIRHALAAGATRVFLVNNDLFVQPATFALLEAALDEPGVGIVGPRLVYAREPTRIWCAGGRVTYRQNLSTLVGHRATDGPQFRSREDVDYVPGCAMLVEREVFEQAGLLAGEYFAYHEDVEFCITARESGFRCLYVGDVVAHHDAHHTTGGGYNRKRKYMMGVNTVWFLRRHGSPARWLSFFLFDVASLPFVWLLRAVHGEGRSVLAKARGTWDGLRGRRVTAERLRRFD
ncbi:MAG: glycosyltransferase family 2 protein [Planctomycetota bacterium]